MNEGERAELLARTEVELKRLPVCEWAKARPIGDALREILDDPEQRRRFFLETDAHRASCPTCQARLAVIDRLDRETGSWFSRALVRRAGWAVRRPVWMQPAITGATFFGAYSIIRIVGATLFGRISPLVALEGLVLSASIGGALGLVGGNAYRLLKPKGEQWGTVGPYVAGLIFAGILGLTIDLVLLAIPDTSPTFREPLGWEITGVLALIFGLVAGGAWFGKGKKFRLG